MWSGLQSSCHQLSDQLEVWQVDIFWHGWLASQLQLTGCLSIKMSTWPSPRQRHLLAKCVTTLVRLTCGQMYSPRQRHLVARCVTTLVRLTFAQMYLPGQRHLVAKCDTTSGQADIWSDLWVRLPFHQMYPQAETSCGQVWYYVRSGWPGYWRVSLVPAAIVIPAPLAYIKFVAVKKLIGLLYERPPTHKSNYLVSLLFTPLIHIKPLPNPLICPFQDHHDKIGVVSRQKKGFHL